MPCVCSLFRESGVCVAGLCVGAPRHGFEERRVRGLLSVCLCAWAKSIWLPGERVVCWADVGASKGGTMPCVVSNVRVRCRAVDRAVSRNGSSMSSTCVDGGCLSS